MYKNSFVHHVTKIVVDIMFYGGIVACFLVPFFVVWWTGGAVPIYDVAHPFNLILFSSGVCAVYIMWQLKKLFKTLLGGNPFIMDNVNCFRKIAVASLLAAVIFVVKCVMYFTYTSVLIVTIFVIAMLFCLTLKDVFKQAVYYKEENDWTV